MMFFALLPCAIFIIIIALIISNNMNHNHRYRQNSHREDSCLGDHNFTESRHKFDEELKQKTINETHQIKDAHPSISTKIQQKMDLIPLLSCGKINKNHFMNQHNEFHHTMRNKQLCIISDQPESKSLIGHVCKQKRRESSATKAVNTLKEEIHHLLPPLYNIKLEDQQGKLDALKRKIDQAKLTLMHKSHAKDDDSQTKRRYHSIELKSYNEYEVVSKSRALSAFKKVLVHEKIKTFNEIQRKITDLNSLDLNSYQKNKTIESLQSPALMKNDPIIHKQKECKKKDIEMKIQCESIKPITYQTLEQDRIVTIVGIEPSKELHSHHKKYYPHPKDQETHKVSHKANQKRPLFTPWENLKEQASIVNLQINN